MRRKFPPFVFSGLKRRLGQFIVRRGLAFGIGFFCAGLAFALSYWKKHGGPLIFFEEAAPAVRLYPLKESYFHDEFVEWALTLPEDSPGFPLLRRSTAPLMTWVEKGTVPVSTIGLTTKIPLAFDEKAGQWRARWPVPWNAHDGEYAVVFDSAAWPAGQTMPGRESFRVVSRPFKPLPPGFSVLTLEGLAPFGRYRAPDGTKRPSAIAEWAEFMGADAVVVQGAESSGYTSKLSKSFPWQARSEKGVAELAQACRERGLQLGVYVLCFMVGGPAEHSPDYQYGWHYEFGRPVHGLDRPVRRGISIADPDRPGDIVKILNRWADVPGVDFVGLDYIRPVFGGNELVEDFVRDMPGVRAPERWEKMSRIERMAWIGPGRYVATNLKTNNPVQWKLSDQWFWYRAHRTAEVLRKITKGYAGRTPLWGFTLSWQKGWEHGQDPVMFRDAGLDMDAIMLYEADGEQFQNLVGQWRNYAARSQLNLILGDTFDWRLHQKTRNPAGPEDFFNRMTTAAAKFHSDGPARGLFTHDLARALSGERQLGPYGSREWFLAGGAAMTRARDMNRALSYDLKFTVPDTARPGATLAGKIAFGDRPSQEPVTIHLFTAPDLEVSPAEVRLTPGKPSVPLILRWRPNEKSEPRGNRTFIALRALRPARTGERCQIHARYIQGHPGESTPDAVTASPVEKNPSRPGKNDDQ